MGSLEIGRNLKSIVKPGIPMEARRYSIPAEGPARVTLTWNCAIPIVRGITIENHTLLDL